MYNYKLIIFDLDDTLWDRTKLYSCVIQLLDRLIKSNIKLYIASNNGDAKKYCKMLNIDSYFTEILYGKEKNKLDMIRYITGQNPHIKETEILFVDDNKKNLVNVQINTLIQTKQYISQIV